MRCQPSGLSIKHQILDAHFMPTTTKFLKWRILDLLFQNPTEQQPKLSRERERERENE